MKTFFQSTTRGIEAGSHVAADDRLKVTAVNDLRKTFFSIVCDDSFHLDFRQNG